MDKMEANLYDPYILITDKKISNIQEILPLLEQVVQAGVLLPELVELPHAVRVEEAHHGDEDEDGPEVFLPYEGQAESFEFLSHSFGA